MASSCRYLLVPRPPLPPPYELIVELITLVTGYLKRDPVPRNDLNEYSTYRPASLFGNEKPHYRELVFRALSFHN